MSEKKQNEVPQVGTVDPSKKSSPIVDGPAPQESGTDTTKRFCWFNGQQFTPGAQVCSGGVRLRCSTDGNWYKAGIC